MINKEENVTKYTIGEAAQYLGMAPSALRYYEKEGLLPFVKRSKGGKRVFTEEDFAWLTVISCLKRTGLPIKQICEFVELTKKGDATISERKRLFYKQREEVERQIAELEANREILDYKCLYYEMAEKSGSTEKLAQLNEKDVPHNLRSVYKKIKSGRL